MCVCVNLPKEFRDKTMEVRIAEMRKQVSKKRAAEIVDAFLKENHEVESGSKAFEKTNVQVRVYICSIR